jgi:membrane-bound metal-dependent hydrolase YbcI (DUF457 family)
MFIGHYAVGFAGRAALRDRRVRPSLGTWFLAVQWLDLIWPVLVVLGIERVRVAPAGNPFLTLAFTHYPWTHSLLAAAIWAALFAVVYGWRTGNLQTACWLGGGVLSHWILDLLVHVPDLPLYPGSGVRLGFGLWRFPAATVVIEAAMFTAAVASYSRRTDAVDRAGRWAFWAIVGFLGIVYVSSVFGPPPPSEKAVGTAALLLWLLVPWAYWIDRHRAPRDRAVRA